MLDLALVKRGTHLKKKIYTFNITDLLKYLKINKYFYFKYFNFKKNFVFVHYYDSIITCFTTTKVPWLLSRPYSKLRNIETY